MCPPLLSVYGVGMTQPHSHASEPLPACSSWTLEAQDGQLIYAPRRQAAAMQIPQQLSASAPSASAAASAAANCLPANSAFASFCMRTPPRFPVATSPRSDDALLQRRRASLVCERRVSMRGDARSLSAALGALEEGALCQALLARQASL